jgi:hypothetical protein
VLSESAPFVLAEDPDRRGWILEVEAWILLAEGDREGALEKAQELLRYEREREFSKGIAARVWWIARAFGEDAAGGPEDVASARKQLEALHFFHAFQEADLFARVAAR